MNPKVSWLMPAYKATKTIGQAIESMQRQTFSDFEMVIVLEPDDEDTETVCRSYADKDARIRIIKNIQRMGIAGSLNNGLAECRGEYIARMDADDICYPNRLELQVKYLEEHPDVGLLAGNARMVKNREITGVRYEAVPDSEMVRAWLLFETCIVHPTIMLRASAYNWKYPDEVAEDYALFASIISKVKIEVIPQIVIDYIDNGFNACNTNFEDSRSSGYVVSRRAIRNELGINCDEWGNSHFGWRYYDYMPDEPWEFLKDNLKLLCMIYERNKELQRFDEQKLVEVLNNQWGTSLWLIRPYNQIEYLWKDVRSLSEKEIDDLQFQLSLCGENKKIVIYGTGVEGKEVLLDIKKFENVKVVAVCDSDEAKRGISFEGYKIINPSELGEYEFDFVCIATRKYENEIEVNLVEKYGINREKIHNLRVIKNKEIIEFQKRYFEGKQKITKRHSEKRGWLFCAPDYGNIGDHAIAEAEHRFFEDAFGLDLVEVPCAENRAFMEIAKKQIAKDELLVITGGGFLGSLWPESDRQVREILNTFPDNPVVIMPQTLYWGDKLSSNEEAEKILDQNAYKKHAPNILLCARDKVSLKLMRESYPFCDVRCFPDMTLYMNWDEYYVKGKRDGVLLCLKDDKESALNEEDLKNIWEYCDNNFKTTVAGNTSVIGLFAESDRKRLISEKLNQFVQAEVVITDRLHGMLFSAFCGTPCVVMNNCNHKVREAAKWFEGQGNIIFIDSPAELRKAVDAAQHMGEEKFCCDVWKMEFQNLKEDIKRFLER